MMNLDKIHAYAQSIHAQDATGHDFHHIMRVERLARSVALKEQVTLQELEIIRASALLHDVIDDKLVEDVAKAKEEVKALLREAGASDTDISTIMEIISNLSYSKNLTKRYELPKTGQIVQDADRIDALGAIGIARAFYYGGSQGDPLYDESAPRAVEELNQENYRHSASVVNHFYEKLLVLHKTMNTSEGKRIAAQRTAFMKEYLETLFAEIEGEK